MVVRDRQMLAKDGILMVVVSVDRSTGEVVAGPDVVSRGFLNVRNQTDVLERAKQRVRDSLNGDGNGAGDVSKLRHELYPAQNQGLWSASICTSRHAGGRWCCRW